MRGNRKMIGAIYADQRSIPAYAGEPAYDGGGAGRAKVYPRVCGGTDMATATEIWRLGLSPRMRGNLRQRRESREVSRSIPAYAGEPW